MPSVGQELLNTPFPEMVQKLALSIAEAQTALDENSTRVAAFMAKTMVPLPQIADPTQTTDFSLISLGFFPGYYQFQEAIIEVKMAITMATSSEFKIGATAKVGYGPFSASVNASYSRKYEYKAEGSSLLRVKLAPAPPPAILQNYMDTLIDVQSKKLEAERKKAEVAPPAPPEETPTLHLAPGEIPSGSGGSSMLGAGGSGTKSGSITGSKSGGSAPPDLATTPSYRRASGPQTPSNPPAGHQWPSTEGPSQTSPASTQRDEYEGGPYRPSK